MGTLVKSYIADGSALAQLLGKMFWWHLLKADKELPCAPTVPLLGTYPLSSK